MAQVNFRGFMVPENCSEVGVWVQAFLEQAGIYIFSGILKGASSTDNS
jgi:hypothetical protein